MTIGRTDEPGTPLVPTAPRRRPLVWGWFADPIWASGRKPRQQAGHMTALEPSVRFSPRCHLHPRGRPHMHPRGRPHMEPRQGPLPLEPFILVGVRRGPTVPYQGPSRPPQSTNQWADCKGPRPLPEVREDRAAKSGPMPPGGFKGGALAAAEPSRRPGRRCPRLGL
jgi:hypothetical protein